MFEIKCFMIKYHVPNGKMCKMQKVQNRKFHHSPTALSIA